MQRRFMVVLTWDNETQVYVVTVPALPGCVLPREGTGKKPWSESRKL